MYKQEGYDLVGAAFEVHRVQGGGLAEEIYQQSLEHELLLQKIPFESKKKLTVYYKDKLLDTFYIPDLFVCDGIIAELKAVKEICDGHRAQLLNYMRITNVKVGYILNFGKIDELEWERLIV